MGTMKGKIKCVIALADVAVESAVTVGPLLVVCAMVVAACDVHFDRSVSEIVTETCSPDTTGELYYLEK